MKLKPLAEILAMTKEKLDESLAPMRARQVRAKADLEIAKLEERAVTLEREVAELCSKKDIDFDAVVTKLDDHDLNSRRMTQLKGIVADLFPNA